MFAREIEASVQMRLYTLSKRHFVVVFGIFFASLGLAVLMGIAGPNITTAVERFGSTSTLSQDKKANLNMGAFKMRSPSLSVFHQQMWLTCTVLRKRSTSGQRIVLPLNISLNIQGVSQDNRSHVIFDGQNHGRNRHRELNCNAESCQEIVIFHISYLAYTVYTVSLRFNGFNNISQEILSIDDIIFHFRTYNPAFTQLEIWIRFLFLVLTFITVCAYLHSLRRFVIRDWSIEQRWMAVLLPLLLLYNDPILPLTFLVNSWIPGILDAIFQATFLCSLLLFWLCLYHGVRQNKRYLKSFYLPKLFVVGLIWLSSITLAAWQEYNELADPTYNYKVDAGNFLLLKVFFFCIGSLYAVYLIYLVVRAYAELRAMPYFDLRLKFTTVLMSIVVTASLVITGLRFGTAFLDDNFVAEIATHYQNSAELLAFYGLLNFYTYVMAFVYSPSVNASYESHFKDNPTISMLNDSDEDVIYGSDYEESALINNGRGSTSIGLTAVDVSTGVRISCGTK